MIFSKRPLWHLVFLAAAFPLAFQPAIAGADEPPVLKLANGNTSHDGHAKIEWIPETKRPDVVLQQANSKTFQAAKVIYRGADRATFISGLEDGTYYYRIRHVDGPWSSPVSLTVKHHSLRLAFALFGLGAVVFVLTVFIVIKGALSASTD